MVVANVITVVEFFNFTKHLDHFRASLFELLLQQ